jgi:NAD(P)H-flavin reductase/hemoglobin-like flavoprotein
MTYFYGHLFTAEPEIGAMFPAAMDAQRHRLAAALTRVFAGYPAETDALTEYLTDLGRAHRKYGVRDEHFDAFRNSLVATLHKYAADDEQASAMTEAFDWAAQIMIRAAEEDASRSPAWWIAEVAGHEPRGSDIAVLTIRPEEPYPYLPGQHVTVQTPRWPRLWRDYWIANAPRQDGTFILHVRAVPGGLVSNALVHHVRPGDTLLLGGATGKMTADTLSPRDVLCLAGGTGLAPLKAITEAISRSTAPGQRREIVLYHGVRREADLYDLAELRRMELDYPWLQVLPVTSEGIADGIMHGTIDQLAPEASWAGRDVYISGPAPMIIATVHALTRLGAPAANLHYDLPTGILDLHLPPAGHPLPVHHLVVPEQRGCLGLHEIPDLAEDEPDLLLGPRIGPRLDGVPQRADVGGPHDPGRDPLGSEPAHERGLGLLLVHLHAVLVQPEVLRHPPLERFHRAQQLGCPLHQLGVLLGPRGKPEGQLVQANEAQRLLRKRRSRTMSYQFMGQDPRSVVQHERERSVLEHRPVPAGQDVLQVLHLIVTNPADVRVQPGLPRPVAHLPGELGEVLRVDVELVPVQPFQPAFPANLPQVGTHRFIIDGRPGDQEHLRLNTAHASALYLVRKDFPVPRQRNTPDGVSRR